MVLEITSNPDCAVDEEEHSRRALHFLRLHNVELHGATILRNRLFDGGHSGHVHGIFVLQTGQDFLRLGLWQLPKRAAVLVQFSKESPNLRVDTRIGRSVGNLSGSGVLSLSGCEMSNK